MVTQPPRPLSQTLYALARWAWLPLALTSIILAVLGTREAFLVAAGLAPCGSTNGCELVGSEYTPEILRQLGAAGLTPVIRAWMQTGITVLSGLIWFLPSALLWAKSTRTPMALLGAYVFTLGLQGIVGALPTMTHPALLFLTSAISALGQFALPFFLLAFPTGRLVPRWTVVILAFHAVFAIDNGFRLKIIDQFDTNGLMFLASVVAVIIAMLIRFRRTTDAKQHMQTKWAVFGFVLSLALMLASIVMIIVSATAQAGVWFLIFVLGRSLAVGLLPAGAFIALLRHRLFDIDVIIRKTLQWTVVTVLLGAVYVLSVLGLQELFKRVTGQTSEIAVALSTLALAAAFMPIRSAAQNLIDKRFYRKRYNAQQVVEAYAESIKDEVDVNVIHQKMLTVLGETLQPKKITLFLIRRQSDL